jgi:hypothetical protein
MSGTTDPDDRKERAVLLVTAFRHVIQEPDLDSAFQRFYEITGGEVDAAGFRQAVATCLKERLIYDPVRIPEGALQCHWRLELTPAGVSAVRDLIAGRPDGR